MKNFLEFIAGIFGVGPSEISEETAYGDFEKWDSMMMLRLVMEIEEEYGAEIPIDEVPNVKTLGDLYRYVQN